MTAVELQCYKSEEAVTSFNQKEFVRSIETHCRNLMLPGVPHLKERFKHEVRGLEMNTLSG